MRIRRQSVYLVTVCVFSGAVLSGLYNYLKYATSTESLQSQSEAVGIKLTRSIPSAIMWQRTLHTRQKLDSQYHTNPLSEKFPFKEGFEFPQPKVMLSISEIEKSRWIYDLRQYLNNFTHNRPLSLATSNSKYTDVLLNWLISATVRSEIPLNSILVLSLDHSLHTLLSKKQIPSVFVPAYALFNPTGQSLTDFQRVMMMRLAVMRVLSHFGADVVMYDTDAVILRDPQPIYDALPSQDIIGSVGKIPFDLAEEWGITICIGVVLVKSTPKTETYWNSMKDIYTDSVDDQQKLNCGLKALDVRWFNSDSSQWNTTVCGITKNTLSVCILPYNDICRQWACETQRRGRYYIWHKGGHRTRKDKLVSARDGQTWFLKYKWGKIKNTFTGVKWLNSIAYVSVVHS